MKKLSLNEIKKVLPKQFLDNIYNSYDYHTVDKILQGIASSKKTTCRINLLKSNFKEVSEHLKENNIKYNRVLWYQDALILECDERLIEKTMIYREGKIYLQSISSMIPVLVLEPKEGENILDIAAAPGGKTTQISCFMKNTGLIVAYELNQVRYEKLIYNIRLQGATNIEVIRDSGENVTKKYIDFFDKVLVDAPCSGEGKFRIDNLGTFNFWSERLVKNSVKTQKKLLAAGIKAARKNGIIVYSTCTLNNMENEKIVEWAIERFPLEIKSIEIKGFNLPTLNTIKGCLKIYQTQISEGFFVAKFIKK